MKHSMSIIFSLALLIITGCKENGLEEKGFAVRPTTDSEENDANTGINNDSLKFDTRPSNVLLTGDPSIRLTTVYKVNFNKENKTTFIGSNSFYGNYSDMEVGAGNIWHYNLMPGLEAVYGYNMVNISLYDISMNKQKNLFEKPVLIKTLYYPSFSKDTLNFNPVKRNYLMVSAYDEDTNKDGFINIKDLRRLYLFDIHGENKKLVIPENYSVIKSEYDPENDFMYVFAKLDENNNGIQEDTEPIHIYWIDLNDPVKTGRQY